MRKLYYAATPYQIFNVCNLVFNDKSKSKSDIVIVNQFTNAIDICDALKKEKLFDNIYVAKKISHKTSCGERIALLNYCINKKAILKKTIKNCRLLTNNKYDKIYSSILDWLVISIRRNNPESKNYYFDDGLTSYFGEIASFSKKFKIISKLFGFAKYILPPRCQYLNNTNAISSDVNYKINSLPKIKPEFISLANRIFNTTGENLREIIFLSQPDESFNYFSEVQKMIYPIFKKYAKYLTIRLHPRETLSDIYQNFDINSGKTLWELYVAQNDMNNKILIGYNTTALFTPKLLFNKEPYVILLKDIRQHSKILQNKFETNLCSFNECVKKIKFLYSEPNKIFIPKSVKEVDIIIDKIINTLSQQ